jgi:hypothetical protein
MSVVLAVLELALAATVSAGTASAQIQSYTATILPLTPYGPLQPRAITSDAIVGAVPDDVGHAMLFDRHTGSWVTLDVPGHDWQFAMGASSNLQVGMASSTSIPLRNDAILWSGSAASATILTPSAYHSAGAVGIDGTDVVGWAALPSQYSHALLWHGNATDFVDLNIPEYIDTVAVGVNGGDQVGWGDAEPAMNSFEHALLWHGTAASVVDLGLGEAWSVANGEQVGVNGLDGVLWHGTASSRVSLTPAGFYQSNASATNGHEEVGWGGLNYNPDVDSPLNKHALAWFGNATDYIDLHSILPSGYDNSAALAIDADGSIVGWASGPDGYQTVLWSPASWHAQAVPEPNMGMWLCAAATCSGGLGALRRRLRANAPRD